MLFVKGVVVLSFFFLHGFYQIFGNIICNCKSACGIFGAIYCDEIIMSISLYCSCSAGSQEDTFERRRTKRRASKGIELLTNDVTCCQNARCARGAICWCVCKGKRHDFSFKFTMKPVSYLLLLLRFSFRA